MTKIYLAKSNRANPDDVIGIRSILQKYPKDIEIVEFKGGTYSHKDLQSCDVLIVIPDLNEYDSNCDDYIIIGKGLYGQIEAFKRTHPNEYAILVVLTVTEKWDCVMPLYKLEEDDTDDYINYGSIIIDSNSVSVSLEDVLRFNLKCLSNSEKNNTSYSDYTYLLIGRKKNNKKVA